MMDKNEGHNEDAIEAVLQRFVLEDAVGQFRRREGLMAILTMLLSRSPGSLPQLSNI